MKTSDYLFWTYAVWGIGAYFQFANKHYTLMIISIILAIFYNLEAHKTKKRELIYENNFDRNL